MTLFSRLSRALILSGFVAFALTACGQTEQPLTNAEGANPSLRVTVYKSESCGCCKEWVKHLERAGFSVDVHDLSNLATIKQRVGVPAAMGSCHTAQIGGYFVEGHVPADDIKRLLRERPDAKGLTVPAMPAGSPGMEVPSGQVDPYDVFLVSKDGSTSVYAHHGS
jgi:hypothetical protein